MYDIIVIGAGPAGMTAALYAKRAGKNVLLTEKEFPGGQIVNSPLVENYPALPGVSGADLAEALQKQVTELGVKILTKEVVSLKKEGGVFVINDSEELTARAVILATGVSHRALGLEGEEDLIGMGVSFCAVCDGAFYRGAEAVVIGGGDTALQDAVYLSGICSKVYLVHRRSAFRAAAAIVEKAKIRGNIEFVTPYVPVRYLEQDGAVAGVVLRNAETGEERVIEAEGIFLAVGQSPQAGFVRGLAELTPEGYLAVGEDSKTNVPGLFAAGDCRAKKVRQLTTAVGDGAVAALAACDYLDA